MVEVGTVEGLAVVPPGPGLAALLAAADPARLPGERLVELLQAQARQCAHDQARLWAALVEVGLAVLEDDPDATADAYCAPLRRAEVAEWAAGEVAAALTWTHRTAERELDLAEVVVRALPTVWVALSDGWIDRGKAVVFAEHLDPAHGLTAAQTGAILDRLLPLAAGLTTSQLRGRLWRAVLAVDPGWARRRYDRAVRGRAVTAVLADDGTVTVTGSGLPADEAAVACARVDRLAQAAKRAGHHGRVGQIAADVFLGLLGGRFHDRSEEQIIAALLRDPRPDDASVYDPGDAPDDAPDTCTPDTDDLPDIDDRGTELPTEAEIATGLPNTNGQGAERSAEVETVFGVPDSNGPSGELSAGAEIVAAGEQDIDECSLGALDAEEWVRSGVEVRVGLTTLLGLDESPGEIPGLGPILAPVARALVARQRRGAQWRFAVTDPDGYLVLAGVTRRRPGPVPPDTQSPPDAPSTHIGGPADIAGRCSGGVVELHVPAAQLDRLTADAAAGRLPDGWAGIVADIAAQHAGRHALLAGLDTRPGDRFPGSALARHVQVRDRTCSHPGCRRPARHCDLDHTHDHARGGATTRRNLGPGCRRHHVFKHELGWRLAQPRPGRFVWTSPLGQVYRTRGEPITPPLPPPVPRPDVPNEADETAGRRYQGPILLRPDSRPRQEARPPPRPAGPDEPPPF